MIPIKVRSIKLPKELEQALKTRAREKGVSDSFVMREALAEYLVPDKEDSARDPRSFAALTADLAGCVAGPADLSTNPRHMAGFGR